MWRSWTVYWTAVLGSPQEIEPEQWLVAVGRADYVPRWAPEKEMTRFMNLAFQHMADTAERLKRIPRSSLSRYSA